MMMNQAGNSRMDTVLKLLMIAFISLLAFSSGVFFGKQLSDSDYKLKALESDFQHAPTQVADEGGEYELSPEDAISEEEVAALSDKMVDEKREEARTVASESTAGGHGHDDHGHAAPGVAAAPAHDDHGHAAPVKPAAPVKAAAAPAKVAHDDHGHAAPAVKPAVAAKPVHADHGHAAPAVKPDLSAAHKAATRVANNAAPTTNVKPKDENRIPNSLPKTVGASQDVEFTVQIASYPTADRAKEHAGELVGKGYPAFHVAATINGKTWYRVSVGSFKTMKEASGYRAQLLKQADVPTAIVQKIQR